ncbi:MAG: hypothetical protein LBD81_03775 [Holosporaceae bacterium]|jgi:hypothetical protein|nr:hypothetical protein [Holosporaceae bacterium]
MFKLKYVAILSVFGLVAGMSEAMNEKVGGDKIVKPKRGLLARLSTQNELTGLDPTTNSSFHNLAVNVFALNKSSVVTVKRVGGSTGENEVTDSSGIGQSYFKNIMESNPLTQKAAEEALGIVNRTGWNDTAKAHQLVAIVPAMLAKMEYMRFLSFVTGWQQFAGSFLRILSNKRMSVVPAARSLVSLARAFAELHPDDAPLLSEYMINWLSLFVTTNNGALTLQKLFGVVQLYISELKKARMEAESSGVSSDDHDIVNEVERTAIANLEEVRNIVTLASPKEAMSVANSLDGMVTELYKGSEYLTTLSAIEDASKPYDYVKAGDQLHNLVRRSLGGAVVSAPNSVVYVGSVGGESKSIVLKNSDKDAIMLPLSVFKDLIQNDVVALAYDDKFMNEVKSAASAGEALNIIGANVGIHARNLIKAAVISPMTDFVGGFIKHDADTGKISVQGGVLPEIIQFMVLFNTLFGKDSFKGGGPAPVQNWPKIEGQGYKELMDDSAPADNQVLQNAIVRARPDNTRTLALSRLYANLNSDSASTLRNSYGNKKFFYTASKVLDNLYASIARNLRHISGLPLLLQQAVFSEISIRAAFLIGIASPTLSDVSQSFMHGSFVNLIGCLAKGAGSGKLSLAGLDMKLLDSIYGCVANIDDSLTNSGGLFSLTASAQKLSIEGGGESSSIRNAGMQLTDGLEAIVPSKRK